MSEPAPVNPFIEYRHHLDTYRRALAAGWSDERWCAEVGDLDARVAEVDGHGFTVTPLAALDTPLERPVWGKVETGSVAGSHKARHLFALALSLAIDEVPLDAELAIASCGNAALAAALGKLDYLSYSRDQEAEADRMSVRYLADSPYACDGVGSFFAKLQREGDGVNIPELLSDHPGDESRIRDIAAEAERLQCDTTPSGSAEWTAFQESLP